MRRFLALLLLAAPALAATVTGWPDLVQPARGGAPHPLDAAVVIGVGSYVDLPRVPYAERDAEAFARHFVIARGIPASRVQHLTDPEAIRVEMALDRALSQVGPDGTLWITFTGHGLPSETDGTHLLLAADAGRDPDRFALDSPLSVEGILARLDADDAGAAILIVDAGFGGIARDGTLLDGRRAELPPPPLPRRPSVVAWLAAGPGAWAGPLEEARMGMFSWHVLAALRGWADGALRPPDGTLTLQEAQHWVARHIVAAGRDQAPSEDPRAAARAMVLARDLPPPPRRDTPTATLPSGAPVVDGLDLVQAKRGDGGLPTAEIEASIRSQYLHRADAAWSRAYGEALRGNVDALRLFIDQYGTITYYHQGRLFTMTAPQLPEARRMLRNGGRPTAPLIDAVTLDPGVVALGSPVDEPGRSASENLSTVTLTRPISMSRTEVTQRIWTTVTGRNPSATASPDRPVTGVTWFEVVLFCNGLSALDGYDPAYTIQGRTVTVDPLASGWRLPTEAEWMHALGPVPGAATLCEATNVRDRSVSDDPTDCDDGWAGLAPASAMRTNVHGVAGLLGNAAEWTADAWATLPGVPRTDPDPGRGPLRVVKGGSYLSPAAEVRGPARWAQDPREGRDDLGFRVVRTLPPPVGNGR